MAKQKSIGYQLKNNLKDMIAYGESKKEYMDETRKLRQQAKKELLKQGYSKEEATQEANKICTYKNKIFGKGTFETYNKAIDAFENFLEEAGPGKYVSIEEAKNYLQAFVDWGIEKRHSHDTIHVRLSGICKVLELNIADYDKPQRKYAAAKRGTKVTKNSERNKERAAEGLELNRAIGLSRSELANLTFSDIAFSTFHDPISGETVEYAMVHSIGKGGKENHIVVNNVATLKTYIEKANIYGIDYLLSPKEMCHDANLHLMRAARAQEFYNMICTYMDTNPTYRDFFTKVIETTFQTKGKRLKEDLGTPYRLRGDGRKYAIKHNKPVDYDRVAVLMTSLFITCHWRSDTTVQHYLIKNINIS